MTVCKKIVGDSVARPYVHGKAGRAKQTVVQQTKAILATSETGQGYTFLTVDGSRRIHVASTFKVRCTEFYDVG